jgi:proline iminopeptidase
MRGETGQVETSHGRIYYEIQGDGNGVPLLVLHGGPAGGHEYMAPLGAMLGAERPVVLYDQLGCGRSDRPDDPALWRIERFAQEVGGGSRGAGARSHPPVGAVVWRDARDRVHGGTAG